jgi:hypothetical protein
MQLVLAAKEESYEPTNQIWQVAFFDMCAMHTQFNLFFLKSQLQI